MNFGEMSSDGSEWYEAWARVRVAEDEGATVFCGTPPRDFPAFVDTARNRGADRIVCGFLPDEVDCMVPDWPRKMEYFVERMEFLPFLMESAKPPVVATDAAGILCLLDDKCRGFGSSGAEVLARSWADSCGCSVHVVARSGIEREQLPSLVARAKGIVNGIDDWLVGFAVDEYACRTGCAVIRVRNPGYSPLRYAPLGMRLPSPSDAHPKLRPLLASAGWLNGHGGVGATDSGDWFGGARASVRWRELMGGDSVSRFWAGAKVETMFAQSRGRLSGWLHRPVGWSALTAARFVSREAGIKNPTWARAVETMTAWLVFELSESGSSLCREWAMARWVRLFPEWLEAFRENAGSVRDRDISVTRWILAGLGWVQSAEPMDGLVAAARAMPGSDTPASKLVSLVHAWRYDWREVARNLPREATVEPALRSVCARAAWAHIEMGGDALVLSSADEALAGDAAPWAASMGAAGHLVRLAWGMRLHRRDVSRAAWRDLTTAWGATGIAGFGRLLQAVGEGSPEWENLLGRLGALDPECRGLVLAEVLTAWAGVRRWRLWRGHTEPQVRGELEVAVRVASRLAEWPQWNAVRVAIVVRLAAWTGSHADVVTAIAEAVSHGGRAAELASVAALAFWLRGQPETGRALLSRWPALADEPGSTLFVRALAHQLLGETNLAAAALARLRAAWPRWPVHPVPNDGHFAWGALVFKRTGRVTEADCLRARAITLAPECREMLDEMPTAREALADGWRALFTSVLSDRSRSD
jgi:hypothetical protein